MKEISELKQDLKQLKQSFDQRFSLTPEHRENKGLPVLLINLSNEIYAIPLKYVQEVIKLPIITKVPCSPAFIIGIINLKGELITISDIKSILALKSSILSIQSRIIVTKELSFTTGILVDQVSSILSIDTNKLQPPSTTLSSSKREFIEGVFYSNHDLVILLDMIKLFESSEMDIKRGFKKMG